MENNNTSNMAQRPSHTPTSTYIPAYPYANQVVGMAYVPWQNWRNIYPPCKALSRGTIFQELDKPFEGVCVK